MNWLQGILKALTLVPVIVSGIEQIHAGAAGSTKKQMAQEALGLAAGIADIIDPAQQPNIDAVAGLISQTIDATVSAFNLIGVFTHKAK